MNLRNRLCRCKYEVCIQGITCTWTVLFVEASNIQMENVTQDAKHSLALLNCSILGVDPPPLSTITGCALAHAVYNEDSHDGFGRGAGQIGDDKIDIRVNVAGSGQAGHVVSFLTYV